MALSTNQLDFGEEWVGYSDDMIIEIRNNGDADLTVSDVHVGAVGFSTDFNGWFVVEPDGVHQLTVTFAPEGTGNLGGG